MLKTSKQTPSIPCLTKRWGQNTFVIACVPLLSNYIHFTKCVSVERRRAINTVMPKVKSSATHTHNKTIMVITTPAKQKNTRKKVIERVFGFVLCCARSTGLAPRQSHRLQPLTVFCFFFKAFKNRQKCSISKNAHTHTSINKTTGRGRGNKAGPGEVDPCDNS